MIKLNDGIGFLIDPCEFITIELLERLEAEKKGKKEFGIGVYSDELIRKEFKREPIKPYSERKQIVTLLEGVDFVFQVDNKEIQNVENSEKTNSSIISITGEKKYRIGYAPGTYDLLHVGHIEHLLEAKKQSEILIVGINNDELVRSYKNKSPEMSSEIRAKIVKALKIVDDVYIANELERANANNWIFQKFQKNIEAVFIGSDWEGKNLHNPENLNIIFTDRDPIKMKKRSSTFYRAELKRIRNY